MKLAGKNVDTSNVNVGEEVVVTFNFEELRNHLVNCKDRKDSVSYKSYTRFIINNNLILHYVDKIEVELETEDKIRFEFSFEDNTLEDMCVAELNIKTGNSIELKIIRKS
ncbi:hypothetical protein P9X10_01360 [Bacillus cereus]|nr:hypothetical protein [Bacillus cereus]